jgi:hypothetical protein
MKPETAALLQGIIGLLNLFLLLATLVVLIFYTTYTYKMQRAAREQTEELIHQRKLSNLPAFIAYPIDPRQSNSIKLYNIGKGVAVNVTCEDVRVPHDLHPEAKIILSPFAAIKPGEDAHSGVHFARLGDSNEQNKAMNAPPIVNYLNDQDYVLTINFLDVEGNPYQQGLCMNHGKCVPGPVNSKIGLSNGSSDCRGE